MAAPYCHVTWLEKGERLFEVWLTGQFIGFVFKALYDWWFFVGDNGIRFKSSTELERFIEIKTQ